MRIPVIVIAMPHARGDALEDAVRANLPACDVLRIRERGELDVEMLARLSPDWVFFPHWSWMIPSEIYERFRCVIFHMTDLPYGRGGSPLQNLIVRGHKDTMLCALQCVRQLDAGPVYLRRPLSLAGTAEQILQRALVQTAEMICTIVEDAPAPVAQQGDPVLFQRRRPEDGNLVGAADIQQVYDYIRMLDGEGYPRAFLEAAGLRLEFSDAVWEDGQVSARVVIRKGDVDAK